MIGPLNRDGGGQRAGEEIELFDVSEYPQADSDIAGQNRPLTSRPAWGSKKMGINRKDLHLLVRLGEENCVKRGGRVMEIGAQQLSNSFLRSGDLVRQAEAVYAAPRPYQMPAVSSSIIGEDGAELQPSDAPFARDFWMALGFEYAAIDVDGSPGSIALDLNFDDIPEPLQHTFDVITNLGTTEHVCNQLNAFKAIHDLAAPGAVMIHHLPTGGFPNHGLVNYNAKFFWHLARSNDYKWLYMDYYYYGSGLAYNVPNNILDAVKLYEPAPATSMPTPKTTDYAIQVALQKRTEMPFVPPLDVDTSASTGNEALERRYWTVFQPAKLEAMRGQASASPRPEGGDLSDKIRSAMNRRISSAVDEIRLAVAGFRSDSEQRVRHAIGDVVDRSEKAIRNAVSRTVSDSEEAIRNAVSRTVSDSEEAIRNAVSRTVSDSEQSVRDSMQMAVNAIQLPGRRYAAFVAASSAAATALLVLGCLIAGHALRWF